MVESIYSSILRLACAHVQSDQSHYYLLEDSTTRRLRLNINHIVLAQDEATLVYLSIQRSKYINYGNIESTKV